MPIAHIRAAPAGYRQSGLSLESVLNQALRQVTQNIFLLVTLIWRGFKKSRTYRRNGRRIVESETFIFDGKNASPHRLRRLHLTNTVLLLAEMTSIRIVAILLAFGSLLPSQR